MVVNNIFNLQTNVNKLSSTSINAMAIDFGKDKYTLTLSYQNYYKLCLIIYSITSNSIVLLKITICNGKAVNSK